MKIFENIQYKYLELIQNTSIILKKSNSITEINSIIGEKIYNLLDKAYVAISTCDDKREFAKVDKIFGFEKIINIIKTTLGHNPLDMSFSINDVDKKDLDLFMSEKLQFISEGIYIILNKKIPKTLCRTAEKLAGIKYTYAMGFVYGDNIYGGITILSKNEIKQEHKLIIEILVQQASMIIHNKWAESQLKKGIFKAEESDKLKSAFIVNISHEIRTPMNAIIGFSQLLKTAENSNETNEYVDIIVTNCEYLLKLMSDILELAKIDSGEAHLTKETISLYYLLNDLRKKFLSNEKIARNKVNLVFNKKEEENFEIESDSMKIYSMLDNLIDNAIKFTKEGKVEFGYKVSRTNRQIEFYVSDTGIGIAPEHQDKIFKRFLQVDNSYTREYGGTGIGLALVNAYTNMLNGSLRVDSEINNGSIFYITIPY